jgi:uncharacterized protein (DUF1501 family)
MSVRRVEKGAGSPTIRTTLPRREFLARSALYGLGLTATMPLFLRRACALPGSGRVNKGERILIVLELTGGNDGLNTIVPFADEYHRLRPTLAIPRGECRRLDDHFGLHPVLAGLERLYGEGRLAIVQGCGYPRPSLSHFESIRFWHTAAPHAHQDRGWIGRIADSRYPSPHPGLLFQLGTTQSLAVTAHHHLPLVCENATRLGVASRSDPPRRRQALEKLRRRESVASGSAVDYVCGVETTVLEVAAQVRQTCQSYRTPCQYGGSDSGPGLKLRQVAALINAGFPTRFFYLNVPGFDTHADQRDLHAQCLHVVDRALFEFSRDLERMGRAEDVAIVVFSEFGRRPRENVGAGTDHGTAGPVLVIGPRVKSGLLGVAPSLQDFDAGGNLRMTTDFRRVYASVIEGWLGMEDAAAILGESFEPLDLFA